MEQDQNTGGTPVQSSPTQVTGSAAPKSPLLFVGAAIAVAIVILLGWFSMQSPEIIIDDSMPSMMNDVPAGNEMPMDTAAQEPDAATTALSAQGTSDDVADIDADLKATDLNSLDTSGI